MRKFMMFAGLMSLLTLGAHADSLFRWIDSEGKVHYGDRPATDAVKVEEKKFTEHDVSDDDTLPYSARQARQNFPVTLYVAENCGDACVQARDFLNKRGIPFTEKFLATKEDNDAFVRAAGSYAIPTLAVGRNFLKGFEAGQWGSELDIAGYPKTAPYGARPVAPSTKPVPAASSGVPETPTGESSVVPASPAE